jgi:hypothetical protein
MSTVKISKIDSVTITLIKTNPPSLLIVANGHTNTGGYKNVRLEPVVYIMPPADGIWEFNMVADAPTGIVNQLVTPVAAQYEWEKFPQGVRGVKVSGAANSKTALLGGPKTKGSPVLGSIQIIKAEAYVNTQPGQPTPGGTLTVSIGYNSNNHGFHALQPAVPQGKSNKILILEITDSNEMIFIFNPRHNDYSVGLQTPKQYTSIELMYEGKMVGSIKKIPVISLTASKAQLLQPDGERVPFPIK